MGNGPALSLLPTPYWDGFEAAPIAADLDEAVSRFVVEDDGGVTLLGLCKDFDAIFAGGFGVGVHAGYEVGVEPDLGRREVSGVERGGVAVPEPDDLMTRGMPRPYLDPDAGEDLPIPVEQIAPAFFDTLLDSRDSSPATILLRHLPSFFECRLLHVHLGVRKARGVQRPADMVWVEVREDHVRHVVGD